MLHSFCEHFIHPLTYFLLQDYSDRFMNNYSDNPDLPESMEDEWMNRCQFECKQCPTPSQFSTRSKLVLHLSNEHKMTIKAYTDEKKSITSTLINHTCKICDKMVRWDKDSVSAHLEKFHSTTPAIYFEKHLKDSLDETGSGSRMLKQAAAKTAAAIKPSPVSKWSDRCKFSCHICYTVVGSRNILKKHLASEHKMCGTNPRERCPSDVLIKVTHGCLICSQELLFDSSVLKKHLESCHGKMGELSYKSEYFKKYSLAEETNDWTAKSRYCCKVCFKIFAGKVQLKSHMASQHLLSSQKNGSGLFEGHFFICLVEDKEQKICSKQVVWDTLEITEHDGSITMTASSRPPNPTTKIATSKREAANKLKIAKVVNSKYVSDTSPPRVRAASTRSKCGSKSSGCTVSPCTRQRS